MNSSAVQVVPNENDVVSGKGSGANKHKGNLYFRQLIKDNKSYYLSLSKNLKMGVARQIFEQIACLDPPGRFLQKNPETDAWFAIKQHRAHEKISQALREKPHAKKLDHPHLQSDSRQLLNSSKQSDGHKHGRDFAYASHSHPQQQPFQQYIDTRQASGQPPSMKVQQVMGQPRIAPMHNVVQTVAIPPPVRVVQQQQQQFGSQPPNGSHYYDIGGPGNYMSNTQQMSPQFQSHGPNPVLVQTRDAFNQFQYQPNQQMQSQAYPMQQGSQHSYPGMDTMHPMQQGSQQSYPSMNTSVMRKVVYTDAQGRVIQESHAQPQMMPVQTVYTEIPSIPEVPRQYLGNGNGNGTGRASAPQQCTQVYSSVPQPQSKSLQYQRSQQSNGLQSQQQPYPSQRRRQRAQGRLNSSYKPSQMPMPPTRYAIEGAKVGGMGKSFPVDARCIKNNARKRNRSNPSEYSTEVSFDAKRQQVSRKNRSPCNAVPQKVKVPLTLQTNSTRCDEKATILPLVSPLNEDKKSPPGDGEGGLNTLSTAALMMSKQ